MEVIADTTARGDNGAILAQHMNADGMACHQALSTSFSDQHMVEARTYPSR